LIGTATVVETVKLTSPSKTSPTSSITNEKSKQFLQQNSLKPDVKILQPSNLQYKILRTGNGRFHPEYDSPTVYHYEGTLIDGDGDDGGTIFDSTYQRGKPAYYQPRQTLPCFAEAMQLMVEGDIWELYVPPELAYGEAGIGNGLVKGGDAVIFKVEMVEIKGTKVPDAFLVRCDINNVEENCTEREAKYVSTARDRFRVKNSPDDGGVITTDQTAIGAEIERIKKVSKKGSDKVIDWSNRRIRILNQFMSEISQNGNKKSTQAGAEL